MNRQFSQNCPTGVALNRQFFSAFHGSHFVAIMFIKLTLTTAKVVVFLPFDKLTIYTPSVREFVRVPAAIIIIVPGSSTNVVYRADDRNDEHDDMMH